jgi:putative nucleotidyltransferase with HDIG domain
VALAGERRILQLVISASVEDFFPQAEQGYSLCKGGLYQHALGTAVFAETLAQFTGRVSADAAYTAGLLHDIGKAVLDQYVAPVFPFFYRQTETEGVDLIAATDLLMSRFLVGQELERLSTDNFALRLERIGLSLSHLPVIIDLMPRGVFEASG